MGGCSKPTVTIEGHHYVLVRQAHTNANGVVDAELYERLGETNHYYTPSLTGSSMMPLMR